MFFVYIMSNETNTVLYTGQTNDLIRRVYEHKSDFSPKSFTARYRAHKLVYYEVTGDAMACIEREKQIKGWNRARKEKLIDTMNPTRRDLYPELLG